MKEENTFDINIMCRVLNVSKSGFYSWKKRKQSKRNLNNEKLLKQIKQAHDQSDRSYGSPRIHAHLQEMDIKCGRKRVERIMRENGIRAKHKKRFRVTTRSNDNHIFAPNILNRNFRVGKANKVWVSDITYIWTQEGWLYLCVIIDLYSRKVIGWSMEKTMSVVLVIKAFQMAFLSRKPEKGLIFHSDRGCQYTSSQFQTLLRSKGITISMSRKGNCWDNACAESFFHTLKTEEVSSKIYATRKIARNRIFEYIEIFYNRKRLHSYLGYKSPANFEMQTMRA